MLNRRLTIHLPFYANQNPSPSWIWRYFSPKSRIGLFFYVSLIILGTLIMTFKTMKLNTSQCFTPVPLVGADPLSNLNHLIIIAGHAVWLGGSSQGQEDSEWILEPYQKGEGKVFAEHARKGLNLLEQDESSLLVFSGGQTRPNAGPYSEAQSYYLLSKSMNDDAFLLSRRTTEEFARDSLENVLFSIARFHEVTGHYPEKITVVSFEFKRERFLNLHREAIRFPSQHFYFVGIDPEGGVPQASYDAEKNNALLPFTEDPYACVHSLLVRKRRERNPYRRQHSYLITCPELIPLIEYCPSKSSKYYSGKLPW
ncbi:hypothetical protein SPOG_00534 [Schizosaccharomyces cryophilus OY26]|uniref:DUF218 domain-containing protein n=1 Tax=Schizosaccharomyces cryophilus (strain OY26 / ATCC MYA-4695 / CBS 11777 / NBRC 106824 / NRRL Y48691) TaxID=653667 RepID=S9XB08_SCHCR|nr:uncharacterized protein SPOG_00534 [Schizosaccharomyces cryophilus OY26]EPY50931.1 hypothetical protein SPOG_00534 [Schizosaccharomyces cryophilus OY26]